MFKKTGHFPRKIRTVHSLHPKLSGRFPGTKTNDPNTRTSKTCTRIPTKYQGLWMNIHSFYYCLAPGVFILEKWQKTLCSIAFFPDFCHFINYFQDE